MKNVCEGVKESKKWGAFKKTLHLFTRPPLDFSVCLLKICVDKCKCALVCADVRKAW